MTPFKDLRQQLLELFQNSHGKTRRFIWHKEEEEEEEIHYVHTASKGL